MPGLSYPLTGNQKYILRSGGSTGEVIPGTAPAPAVDYDLWLDSSDSGTIVFNGSNVERQNDKSGDGNHFEELGVGNQPLFQTNVQNGLSSIFYDGVDDRLTCLNNFQGAGAYTIFIVCGYTGVDTRGIVYSNAGAGVKQCVISRRNEAVGGYLFDVFIRDSSGNVVRPIVNCPQDAHCLLTVQYQDGLAEARVNGGVSVPSANASFVAESYADGALPFIGGNVTSPYHGHIDEVRVAPGIFSTEALTAIELGLISKWGLL